ncbi:class I SAM-dependent DNA methyltransferase [Shewanella sp. GutCb]|uniref:BREX-1 system adenine-specific DNA-methyltransferase PglX n=1 Tax=Shewanella sp. GutCb TaxID=2058315 RepID=UPI000C7A6942|nr:BREX-1 system adenine-specific DNA-methyltransferase PglX [Shewanella sp. GutCb]PKG74686.1 class I SAM-dependent DNA methyltransferase [Shewanella sp. GutCb]
METSRLKKFAQYARRSLIDQVESKLKLVLANESQARRESPKAVAELEKKLKQQGGGEKAREQLEEQVAYTWFNRFCALRFMDVNQYNRIMVLSPLPGQFQPEILAEAKAGHIDEGIVNKATQEKIFGLLGGSIASRDGQSEAFRLLIVAVCNDLHQVMPYLFERIEDYTELLMPDDLLSGNSILAYTREAMTPEACESVESIGWLYQFYISEKKDQVFDDLKKNKKITAENIPAATQLFTPHWIVRYLVENSLGRLWMLNNPSSKVIEQMDYYIKPAPAANGEEQAETDFLRISSPEEIKICDPACGSGHMLTYAYDLLYAIYSSMGEYDDAEIPGLILTKNLYGIEIDERAAELAAFALTMKAIKGNPKNEGNNRRRFFRNPIKPNICRLEKVVFSDDELDSYIDFAGKDSFNQDLRATLKEFEEANNFGSLIQPTLNNPADIKATLEAKDISGEFFLADTHESVLKVLVQADYLAPKYHVVIANPPYMGVKGMNGRLSSWLKGNYPSSKADLYSAFIERNLYLLVFGGFSASITMQNWMFLSSFERLREKILTTKHIDSMLHLGTRAFDSIGGEVVSTTAFVAVNSKASEKKGSYFRLVSGKSEKEKIEHFMKLKANSQGADLFFAANNDFVKVPGTPLSYWISGTVRNLFSGCSKVGSISDYKQGLATCNNDLFVRSWHEVSLKKTNITTLPMHNKEEASDYKWFPFIKGGEGRKWYGNYDLLVNWENDGQDIHEYNSLPMDYNGAPLRAKKYYFNEGLNWSSIASSFFAVRYSIPGSIFGTGGSSGFSTKVDIKELIAFFNSKVAGYLKESLSMSLNVEVGHVSALPYLDALKGNVSAPEELIEIHKRDWDNYETSWDFKVNCLASQGSYTTLLEQAYTKLRNNWNDIVKRTHFLEKQNNKLFVEEYGLTKELEFDIPEEEITLSINPSYRYLNLANYKDREVQLKRDVVIDFIAYSVGCMFGRYSLNKKGLILANQGATLEDYLKQVPHASIMPDKDNVIPLIDFDGDWFEDDIAECFKLFLTATFGEEHFTENLTFIEGAIGKDIKKFFLKDFYTDHIKRYKKRPIYWMFSSPKGSFNALIYMHRYRPDTVSVVLNDYLREFRTKLQARKESYEQIEISASASQGEKTKAIKAIQKVNKVLDEINDYEHDTLYPLAGKSPEIDLDDGVKHNYPLFGKALKKVTGLS